MKIGRTVIDIAFGGYDEKEEEKRSIKMFFIKAFKKFLIIAQKKYYKNIIIP